jgi:uncharacterized OB-fold protein
MEVPQHWRLNAQRYILQGVVCSKCGRQFFPPRAICPECSLNGHEEHKQPANGRVRQPEVLEVGR